MASTGIGTSTHVFGELFKTTAGVDLAHVPYRGNFVPDLIGGQVQVVFAPITHLIAYIKSGQLRALAVTTATRSEALPDVPTLAEFVPGYEATGWYGIGAPKGTPAEVIDRLIRDRHHSRRSRIQSASYRFGGGADADDARRIQEIHRRRNRKVGQGNPGGRHQGGVMRSDIP
jgi:hypothetical protein